MKTNGLTKHLLDIDDHEEEKPESPTVPPQNTITSLDSAGASRPYNEVRRAAKAFFCDNVDVSGSATWHCKTFADGTFAPGLRIPGSVAERIAKGCQKVDVYHVTARDTVVPGGNRVVSEELRRIAPELEETEIEILSTVIETFAQSAPRIAEAKRSKKRLCEDIQALEKNIRSALCHKDADYITRWIASHPRITEMKRQLVEAEDALAEFKG